MTAFMDTLVFKSKIDRWLIVVLVTTAIASFCAAGFLIATMELAGILPAFVLTVAGAGLPLWLLSSTRYTLTAKELLVVSGPFRWSVPLREVHAVTPTRDPLSSPALSLDRLRIDYGPRRWLMISPQDKEGFLREFEARRATSVLE